MLLGLIDALTSTSLSVYTAVQMSGKDSDESDNAGRRALFYTLSLNVIASNQKPGWQDLGCAFIHLPVHPTLSLTVGKVETRGD